MRKLHKITPEAFKALAHLADQLPPMVKTDKNTGAVLLEKYTDRVRGENIPKEDRKKIKDFSPESFYKVVRTRYLYVNHLVTLTDIYRHDGDKGVQDYLDIIEKHLEHEKSLFDNAKKLNVWQKFVRMIKS